MTKENYITLYADEFTYDVWKEYCHACKVSRDATTITIYFDPKEVEAEYEEKEEDED